MSNAESLAALYAAMDGLLTDPDANGSPETAAASLKYHLKQHGLVIRAVTAPSPDALRAALDYLRDKLLDQHQHSQQWIEEAFREADARLAATPSPACTCDGDPAYCHQHAATPSPSSGLDVRKSHFGPYIHGLPGPAVILAVQGYQREPRRIVLPHQVYVETVEKLMAEPGVTEVWALPYRDAEWIRVDEVAAEYARLQEQER